MKHRKTTSALGPSRRDVLAGSIATGIIGTWRSSALAAPFERIAFRGHKDQISSVSIAADFAVTAAQDGLVKLWNLKTGAEEKRFESKLALACIGRDGIIAYTTNDKIFCQTRNGAVRVIDYYQRKQVPTADLASKKKGLEFASMGNDPGGILLSSDSSRVYLINFSTLLEFDLEKGTIVRQYKFSGSRNPQFSPSRQILAFSTQAEEVEVWDIKRQERRHVLWGHKQGIASIATARDGQFLITGSRLRDFTVWDLESGKEVLSASGKTGSDDLPITACALSPNGDYAAVGDYYTVALWDVKTKTQIAVLGRFEREVTCMRFSDDGSLLIAGSGSGEVSAWRLGPATAPASGAPAGNPESSGAQIPEIKF